MSEKIVIILLSYKFSFLCRVLKFKMPMSSLDVRARIGAFHPTFIRILTRKALRPKTRSDIYTPFSGSDSYFTDLTYRCVVATLCSVIFLVNIKLVLLAERSSWYGYGDYAVQWFSGNIQSQKCLCMDWSPSLRTGTGTVQDASCALFGGKELLLLCGDVEVNPGPRQSSARQTRASSSTSVPAPSPTPSPGPTMRDVADLLCSVRGDLAEMKEVNRQVPWLRQDKSTPTTTTTPRDDPPPSTPPTMPTTSTDEQHTGDVMSLLQTLNSKFDAMKANLSELTDMYTVMKNEIASLNDKMSRLGKENAEIKKENDDIKKDNSILKNKVRSLEEKADNLDRHSRKNNLVFFGINRKENETKSECEQAVENVLSQKLGISDDISFDNVRRINRNVDSPIVATVSSHRHKDKLLSIRHKLKGTNIFISDDFSVHVRETRRKLVPFLHEAKASGKKVKLVHDHLVVDGVKMYLGEDGVLKAKS